MKNVQYVLMVSLLMMNFPTWAKTSVYFGVNVPVQQHTTITRHVQPIMPTASVQHYQASYGSSLPVHQQIPKELTRFAKPTSVYYQPPYPAPTHTPVSVVYVPTTVVYQSSSSPSVQANIHFQIGDVVPHQYRQMEYWVSDWQQARLYAPPHGHAWLNVAGQAMLVNQQNYVIVHIR